MVEMGVWVTLGTPGNARYGPSIVTVKVRGFVFKPPAAAQNTNEMFDLASFGGPHRYLKIKFAIQFSIENG